MSPRTPPYALGNAAAGGDASPPHESSDEFRMYVFKIKRCSKARSHDWTDCPYAHRGEKARRRDPRRFLYHGMACPDYRRTGGCGKGPLCEYAHGVFEFWLHPSRYRTRPCKAGARCRRKVCFFAHTPEQLRPHRCHFCHLACRPDGGYGVASGWSGAVPRPLSTFGRDCIDDLSEHCMERMVMRDDAGIQRDLGLNEEEDLPDLGWIWELVK